MDVFDLRKQLIAQYSDYITSFLAIRDERISVRVRTNLEEGWLWPDASIGLNPAFEPGGWISELVAEGVLHSACERIFRTGKGPGEPFGHPLRLHRHQADAIRTARAGRNYVLTTGTGSGKSLSYMVPIVDHVLRVGRGGGVKAIVVYPMNALANSQAGELEKFLGSPSGLGGAQQAARFHRYTGQESSEQRAEILSDPPDIILTNYVMLELILTRVRDRKLVDAAAGLRFLVLDELHTYRGRQGADVALLIRRLRAACKADQLQCVGTSATLSTEGTLAEQRRAVAHVASLLFGAPVEPADVIGETLRRATVEQDLGDPVERGRLADRVSKGPLGNGNVTYDELVDDPLSTWIESTFGVHEREEKLVRVSPRPLEGPDGGARELAELTGVGEGEARLVIEAQLLAGYRATHPDTGFPAFAFRLHQFISKGDTVYASLEPEATRHITLSGRRFVPGHRSKVLLPLSFCRLCGQDYYTVARVADDAAGSLFVPRDLGEQLTEPGREPGFLYLSTDAPWPSDPEEVIARLPEDWLDDKGGRSTVKSHNRRMLPMELTVDGSGRICGGARADHEGSGNAVPAWWVPAPFRMCLRCGVAYAGSLRRDFTKLTTLGSEGRSTATTVLSLAAVRYLRNDPTLDRQARKLLSFTDNRQDASLQAGHFNDFVQVSLLRGALYAAVSGAGPDGLEHEQVTAAVFKALDLPFEHYAVDPEVAFQARRDTERALRDVLGCRLYLDLRRGWRVTSPNLEQCGLLRIAYLSLDEVCRAQPVWAAKHPALAEAAPSERQAVAQVLLDHLRRELAIKVDYLDEEFQEKLVQRSNQRLVGAWAVDDLGELEHARGVLPRSQRPGDYRGWSYLSARSGFGQLLRRPSTFSGYGDKLTTDDTAAVIEDLLAGLKAAGLVEQVNHDGSGVPVYQVPASAMVWQRGDGSASYRDPVRMPRAPEVARPPNDFFVRLYTKMARELVGVEAREHTAQVPYQDRAEREDAFRDGRLPVLYCSPTMELGVDIAQLNVVNMRNVPPTPANYAQRSGRAGRSGQPALVFTYCSALSPHDQWYFHRPQLMVSGAVSTPRLDLANEDLVRSHVQAVWLAASGLGLGSSLREVLEVGEGIADPPLLDRVRAALMDDSARRRGREISDQVLGDLRPELEQATWWSPSWVEDVLNAVPQSFERATERWRDLYRSAMAQFDAQNRVIKDQSRPPGDKAQARRLRKEAETQLELLAAEEGVRTQSDFYSYRYFAGEGFLPGYSFPRLPLSAFIPGRRGRRTEGEFLSRPRFLAISEFGPQSLIYHEGARYRINRAILPVGEHTEDTRDPVLTTDLKRCTACGYLHPVNANASPDVCERCGAEFDDLLQGMFRLQNVSTQRQDRIISDEEERQRAGYELLTGVRFATRHGRLSVRTANVDVAGRTVATLSYGDTANLWRINLGWRRRKNKAVIGFVLDVERGTWERSPDADANDEEPTGARTKRVVPYVEDNRNCLIFEPGSGLASEEMASLQSALKSAIQVTFQLEDDELAAEPLPDGGNRRLLLFYESAEGGAGVLRRLVDEPGALAVVARRAMELCHFDPGTGQDLGGPARGEPCEAACYECLMSYRNQLDHGLLDRKLILPVLQTLASATVAAGPAGGATAEHHIEGLDATVESTLERQWLQFLQDRHLRLPDRAQVYFAEAGTRPDFVYDDAFAVVYVDGPHHEYPDRQERDTAQVNAMRDLGYRVIRFAHGDDWDRIAQDFATVFEAAG